MPSARLNIKKKLTIRSERVKAVDLHPTEPWVLSSLYNGKVVITDYNTQAIVKEFDVSKEVPVRAAKFIPRKRWIITGSDDNMIRIYNYNTSEKEKEFEAHQDYIRSIAVHATKPYILTTSDDQTIKLWNWDRNWQCMQVYEGHHYFVMTAVWNPKDPNIFASASLDGLIRVWSIGSPTPNYTLEGHTKGVNYIDYYYGSDKPFLISGSDDGTVKIWDYQNKSVVQTLEGHSNNVTICCFHPKLPFIITGSEDHVVNIWNAATYKLEDTINSGLERVWAVGYATDTKLAIGYDGGTVVLKLGKEVPVVSMDKKGKIIWALNHDIQQLAIKVDTNAQVQDGEKIALPSKELGTTDVYPQTMQHDPKGRFVSVCGEGEFVIYAAVSWRSKTYGNAEEIVWGTESGCYAIREKSGHIKVFKDFEMIKSFKPFFTPTGLFGGHLIGVKSKEFVVLYDWETCSLIRSIEVVPKSVHWNESGEYLSLCCEDCFYVLKYDQDCVKRLPRIPEEGVEDALQVEDQVSEKVKHGEWVGDAFIYVNNDNKLNYLLVGSETTTIATLDKVHFFLGFVSKLNKVYLMDKERNVVSYTLHVSVMQYETAVIRGDLDAANQILQSIPQDLHNNLARFLHKNGHAELALSVSKDPEHQFELAVELERLEQALEIATHSVDGAEQKWRQLGQVALGKCDFKLAEQCLVSGNDYGGLLLLYTSTGDKQGLERLSQQCITNKKNNVGFVCLFLLHKLDECVDLLVESNRLPEAALFTRSYLPSRVSEVLKLWKADLKKTSERAAEALADPNEYENLFPGFDLAKIAEEQYKLNQDVLAKDYLNQKNEPQEQVASE